MKKLLFILFLLITVSCAKQNTTEDVASQFSLCSKFDSAPIVVDNFRLNLELTSSGPSYGKELLVSGETIYAQYDSQDTSNVDHSVIRQLKTLDAKAVTIGDMYDTVNTNGFNKISSTGLSIYNNSLYSSTVSYGPSKNGVINYYSANTSDTNIKFTMQNSFLFNLPATNSNIINDNGFILSFSKLHKFSLFQVGAKLDQSGNVNSVLLRGSDDLGKTFSQIDFSDPATVLKPTIAGMSVNDNAIFYWGSGSNQIYIRKIDRRNVTTKVSVTLPDFKTVLGQDVSKYNINTITQSPTRTYLAGSCTINNLDSWFIFSTTDDGKTWTKEDLYSLAANKQSKVNDIKAFGEVIIAIGEVVDSYNNSNAVTRIKKDIKSSFELVDSFSSTPGSTNAPISSALIENGKFKNSVVTLVNSSTNSSNTVPSLRILKCNDNNK